MVGQEFRDRLSLFPFVPYAVSLSLSVSYRELRHSIIPMYRTRAQVSMKDNCDVLDGLKDIFWTAAVMADLAHVTLTQLERVHSILTNAPPRDGNRAKLPHSPNSERSTVDPWLVQSQRQSLAQDLAPTGPAAPRTTLDDRSTKETTPLFPPGGNTGRDTFDLFDPDFDFENIDAFLVDNLDLSIPNWF